ncbi:hypothetical protein D082_12030 [Synechocystis sp. PCC 6714]|nr:hypothetical protein D082_12030 [Synechocystis sp. PCC 6714]
MLFLGPIIGEATDKNTTHFAHSSYSNPEQGEIHGLADEKHGRRTGSFVTFWQ